MEISVGAGRHICARGEPELSARNYRTWLPDIDKWSSVVYEILHDLHSYTLTSGAPDLPGIVRTTVIGRKQFVILRRAPPCVMRREGEDIGV